MVPTATVELSQATTDTTKSPAAVANNSLYDMFVWNDSGTIRCTRGPAWTNATTRSAGTALVLVNGIYLNNASITNGPAASRGTYVGTIASNGTATIDFVFGTITTNGGAGNLNIWNAYNRVLFNSFSGDFDGWLGLLDSEHMASSERQFDHQDHVCQRAERRSRACSVYHGRQSGASTYLYAGIGLDSTTTNIGIAGIVPSGSPIPTNTNAFYDSAPSNGGMSQLDSTI